MRTKIAAVLLGLATAGGASAAAVSAIAVTTPSVTAVASGHAHPVPLIFYEG